MKYDDASWHYGGDFPKDLPDSAGATHIAMFVAWAVLNDLAGDLHKTDFVDGLQKLQRHELSPGKWFLDYCDGKFTDEDLNSQGNDFASAYYADGNGLLTVGGSYLSDYEAVTSKKKSIFSLFSTKKEQSLYHVPDTWETFDHISSMIKDRYAEWRNGS